MVKRNVTTFLERYFAIILIRLSGRRMEFVGMMSYSVEFFREFVCFYDVYVMPNIKGELVVVFLISPDSL